MVFKIILMALTFMPCRVIAGDIKGKVIITKPVRQSAKIVSRSLIKRFTARGANHAKGASGSHDEQPTVVVYIEGITATNLKPDSIVVLDQKNQMFVPHVLPILVGTTVRFLNSDEVYHNVFSLSRVKNFDLGRYARGKYRSVRFMKPGVVKVYCDMHTSMNAFILVLENSYFTTIDNDGNFEIKNVPEGNYTIKAWYGRWPEKLKPVSVKTDGVTEVNFNFP